MKVIRKYLAEIVIVSLYLCFAFGYNIYRVQGDGLFYYAFLERILNIVNPESAGAYLDGAFYFQSGCVFLNIPFYAAAYLIENWFNLTVNFNGITLRQASINLSSNFYMICSLILSVKILKRLNFKHVLLPVLSVLFSTSAIVVSVVTPSFNHMADIFITTLFVYMFVTIEKKNDKSATWLGILSVFMLLIRYFNFVFPAAVIIYYCLSKQYKKCLSLICGFCAVAWLLPLMFYCYNGTFSPFYHTTLLSDSYGGLPIFPKYFLKVLIHPLHGIFLWSPVTILSSLGLVYARKDNKNIGYILMSASFLLVLLYGYMAQWHAGWSFSNRYLVSLFPVYIVGLAAFLDKFHSKFMVALICICTLWSVFLFFNWYICIINGQFGTPYDMVICWLNGQKWDGSSFNLTYFIKKLWMMCRYKYLF